MPDMNDTERIEKIASRIANWQADFPAASPVRIAGQNMGAREIYTTAEYESRRARILATPLP